MGWAVAGGVLGIILMFGMYRWLTGWTTARAGGVSVPTIGSRPRRLAGVPEEAPADAKMPPGMEVLRHAGSAIIIDVDTESETSAVADVGQSESAEAAGPESSSGQAMEAQPPPVSTADAASGVRIETINQGSDDHGEYVLISNAGPNPVALENWKLTDAGEKHVYEFQAIVLASQANLRVHMWRGEDTETDVYVGRRNRWWNNTGDIAYLYDAAGTLVHSRTVESTEG